jgi:hypothetical protein
MRKTGRSGCWCRLKKNVVDVMDGQEEAISCVLVRRGRKTCSVGFVPRALHHFQPIIDHINCHAQVCVFMDNIPQDEWIKY